MKRVILTLTLALTAILATAQERDSISTEQDSISTEQWFRELPEVMVRGERPIARMERGAVVYDMPLLLEKLPADNAYEALTRIPGVTETNGKIDFAGQTVTLIINGKATTLSADQIADRLRQMPTDRLARCEVMMAAPARYHVRGAVINIVTRDMYGQQHVSAQLQGIGTFSRLSSGYGDATLLFSQGKFSLDADYNFNGGKRFAQAEHIAVQPLTTGPLDFYELVKQDARFAQHCWRLGMEYAFAQNHRLEVAYNGRTTDSHTHNAATGNTASEQRSHSSAYVHNADLNYQTPFGLRLGASYLNFRNPQRQDLSGTILSDRRDYLSRSGQDISKWTLTADQTFSIKKNWTVGFGAKLQITDHDNWQTTTLPDGATVADATNSSGYTERIGSVYASISRDWEKVSAELSVQAENYRTPLWNEWRAYPTLNLLWRVNPNHSLNLSFQSSADYPNYWDMMQSVYYASAYNEIWGNPDLRPMKCYNSSFTWRFRQRYMLSASFNYNDDYFVQLPFQPSDRLAVIMQETNFNYRVNGYLIGTAQWNIGRRVNGNLMGVLIYTHDKSDHFHGLSFDRQDVTFRLSGTAALTLWPRQSLTLILQPVYQHRAIQGVYDIRPFFSLDASLRWQPTRRLTATLSGTNLTNFHFETTDTWRDQRYTLSSWQNWRSLRLILTYRLGNYKDKQRKQPDTSRMGH